MKNINPNELKTIASIAQHYPKGNGEFGVQTGYVYRLMKEGKLVFEKVVIEGTTFYLISEDDQKKPDWGIGDRLKKSEN